MRKFLKLFSQAKNLIVQRTARKILLLTGESPLRERSSIGRAAVRTIKQGEQDWRSSRHVSNMRSISSIADVHGCVMCPGLIPDTPLDR